MTFHCDHYPTISCDHQLYLLYQATSSQPQQREIIIIHFAANLAANFAALKNKYKKRLNLRFSLLPKLKSPTDRSVYPSIFRFAKVFAVFLRRAPISAVSEEPHKNQEHARTRRNARKVLDRRLFQADAQRSVNADLVATDRIHSNRLMASIHISICISACSFLSSKNCLPFKKPHEKNSPLKLASCPAWRRSISPVVSSGSAVIAGSHFKTPIGLPLGQTAVNGPHNASKSPDAYQRSPVASTCFPSFKIIVAYQRFPTIAGDCRTVCDQSAPLVAGKWPVGRQSNTANRIGPVTRR